MAPATGRDAAWLHLTLLSSVIAKIEKMVEDHWATIRLDPALRDAVEEDCARSWSPAVRMLSASIKQPAGEKARLTAQRQKLVEAIYSGAMPLDLIASEQQRITSQLAGIAERLSATTAKFDEIKANLATALDLARDCHAAYLVERSRPIRRPARSRWPTSPDGPRPAPTTRPPGHCAGLGVRPLGFGICSLCRRSEYVYFSAPHGNAFEPLTRGQAALGDGC